MHIQGYLKGTGYNTADLGTGKKAAVFGNRRYRGRGGGGVGARAKEVTLLNNCTFTYSTKRSKPGYNFSIKYFFWDLRMGDGIWGEGVNGGAVLGGGGGGRLYIYNFFSLTR